MQETIATSLVLLSSFCLVWPAAAQDTPPAKEKAASPFEDAKKEEVPTRPPAKHLIELAQPLAKGKTLEEWLESRGTLHAEEATLKSFAEALETALDTSVVLMTKKLEEAAINTDTPLTYKLKNVRLRTALKLILGEVGLTYLIEDNVLLITTPEDAGAQLVTRVYDCRDLIKMPSTVKRTLMLGGLGGQSTSPKAPLGAGSGEAPPVVKPRAAAKLEEVGQDGYSVDDLIDIIQVNVQPDTWDGSGPGNVYDFKGLVVISQTQEVHGDIEKLLNQLHRAGGLEEKIKVSR